MDMSQMLCARCRSRLPRPRVRLVSTADTVLDGLLCACCAAPLPPESLAGRLISKTVQLTRFGLAQSTAPLLTTTPQPPGDG